MNAYACWAEALPGAIASNAVNPSAMQTAFFNSMNRMLTNPVDKFNASVRRRCPRRTHPASSRCISLRKDCGKTTESFPLQPETCRRRSRPDNVKDPAPVECLAACPHKGIRSTDPLFFSSGKFMIRCSSPKVPPISEATSSGVSIDLLSTRLIAIPEVCLDPAPDQCAKNRFPTTPSTIASTLPQSSLKDRIRAPSAIA